jgi:hypothetical protein
VAGSSYCKQQKGRQQILQATNVTGSRYFKPQMLQAAAIASNKCGRQQLLQATNVAGSRYCKQQMSHADAADIASNKSGRQQLLQAATHKKVGGCG